MNENITFHEFLQLLGKEWKKTVIFVTLITLCGGFSSFLIPPTYEAKIDLLIDNSSIENESTGLGIQEIDMNLRLIETYSYILKSDRMVSKVNAEFKGKYINAGLEKKIKIESNNNSQIITVIAYEDSPKKAAKLANVYAATFQQEIAKLMHLKNIKILKEVEAETDTKKIKPDALLYFLLSFVLGFLSNVIVIIIRELYSTKINNVQKAEMALGIPNLGIIPFANNGCIYDRETAQSAVASPSFSGQSNHMIEAYRRLRENVEFSMRSRSAKTLLITSPAPNDGKSTISGNLSVIMGENGRKAIYIDANFRNSTGRLFFNLPDRKGLTTVITGNDRLENVIQKTAFENVSFIGTGPLPPNPTKFLASNRMKELLEELKERYEIIILDSPPLAVADAVTLSTIADSCLFVVNAKNTKKEKCMKCFSQLTKVNAPLIGSILNKMDLSKMELRKR